MRKEFVPSGCMGSALLERMKSCNGVLYIGCYLMYLDTIKVKVWFCFSFWSWYRAALSLASLLVVYFNFESIFNFLVKTVFSALHYGWSIIHVNLYTVKVSVALHAAGDWRTIPGPQTLDGVILHLQWGSTISSFSIGCHAFESARHNF